MEIKASDNHVLHNIHFMGSAVDSMAIVHDVQYFTYARERLLTDADSPLINWVWRIDKTKKSTTIRAAGVTQAIYITTLPSELTAPRALQTETVHCTVQKN